MDGSIYIKVYISKEFPPFEEPTQPRGAPGFTAHDRSRSPLSHRTGPVGRTRTVKPDSPANENVDQWMRALTSDW